MPYPPSPYDPAAFRGTAPYYARGRPPYSDHLRELLVRELGLDGSGRLLDVGCGPGTLAIALVELFDEVIGLDPEPGMLAEAQRLATGSGHDDIRWVRGVAEDLGDLDLGPCRLVSFGQSFHRTDRSKVIEAVYELLDHGGSVALVCHTVEGRPRPPGTGHPEIPHEEIRALVERHLGSSSQSPCRSTSTSTTTPQHGAGGGGGGSGSGDEPERWEATLRRSSFGQATIVFAPGRPDLVRDTDSVVAGVFSMSWSALPLFGDQRGAFETELRALLRRHSPDGLFWDWPGDTEIVYATKV